jgi:glutamyl-tRNA synthetase
MPAANSVVTRFAPSPTGFLHVGGARTALYNWLYARRHGGRFILRIEDTDQERHVPEAEQAIFDSLAWLGIDWDEGPSGSAPGKKGDGGPNGPYRQSERRAIYDAHFERLLAAGKAYRCYATPAELDAARKDAERRKVPYVYDRRGLRLTAGQIKAYEAEGRPHVVRLKMPDKPIVVKDEIRGEVTYTPDVLEDVVIRKGNGWPTYHFAVVVDDALMQVSHVIRAAEHLPNTPRHIAIQEALGLPTPIYAHIPIVLNADGSKMSKRNKGAKVEDYRTWGFLPDALVNYMALVGWSPGEDREIITRRQMIELFSLDRVNKSNARWDLKKCLNFNARYVRSTELPQLKAVVMDWLGRQVDNWLPAFQTRMETVAEFVQTASPLWIPEYAYEPEALKHLDEAGVQHLRMVGLKLAQVEFTPEAVHGVLKELAEKKGLSLAKVAQPVRVAVTGKTVSPPVNETLCLLGKDETIRRITRTIVERCVGVAGFEFAWGFAKATGQWDVALSLVEAGEKRLSGVPDWHFVHRRADALFGLGRLDEAESAARDFARRFPDRSAQLARVARLWMKIADEAAEARRKKQFDEAINLADKAAKAPNAPEPVQHYATAVKAWGVHRIGKVEPAAKIVAPIVEKLGRSAPADRESWAALLDDLEQNLPNDLPPEDRIVSEGT